MQDSRFYVGELKTPICWVMAVFISHASLSSLTPRSLPKQCFLLIHLGLIFWQCKQSKTSFSKPGKEGREKCDEDRYQTAGKGQEGRGEREGSPFALPNLEFPCAAEQAEQNALIPIKNNF